MKNFKHSSFIVVIIVLFLLISCVGYMLLRENIVSNHEKETEILFYKIKSETRDLLSKLLYQRSTDSYLVDRNNAKNGILEISYSCNDSRNRLLEIQKVIRQYPNIKEAKVYIILDAALVSDVILKDHPSYKPDLKEILASIDKGTNVNRTRQSTEIVINNFIKKSTHYRALYLSFTNPIFANTNIVYSILLDESVFESKIKDLNIFMFFVILLGVIGILICARMRGKEMKFSEQDRFVQSSMHEIKTPLSVITLNNELRELEFGKDEYSQEIDSAIKILKTSYDDMSFSMVGDKLQYPIETISLSQVVVDRAEYFKTIAKSNSKSISIIIMTNSDVIVRMSLVELIRLIDNNLSNAIKYSHSNSTIDVILEHDRLSFHNTGNPIIDTVHVFDKYFRENSVVGGHGLGLSIVSDIAKKYLIAITINSDAKKGTTFSYIFKCHTNDI